MEKCPPGNVFLFLPFLKCFVPGSFPALQAARAAPWGMVNPSSVSVMLSGWGRCCPELPSRAMSGRMVQGLLVARGECVDSEYGRSQAAGSISTLCFSGLCS